MKMVRVDKNREVEVPTSWSEGEKMLTHALGAYYDERGQNLARLSVAARVAHGLFGQQLMAADPTLALLYLLQRICIRRGAGLDNLKERRIENVGRSNDVQLGRRRRESQV
jgi:hypothetical protein